MSASAARRMNIGQVVAELKVEFPDADVKESKLRFLESEGLITPERTPAGYRKYSEHDMGRLRYILAAQRQFLPLKVIGEHLDAIDRGLEPPALGGLQPRVPVGKDGTPEAASYSAEPHDVRVSRLELIKSAKITAEFLDQLEAFGLVRMRPGARHYDSDAVAIASAAAELAEFGVEPRHLRAFRTAADREVGLVEQVVVPLRRSREEGAEGRAAQAMDEVAALSVRLHSTLVRVGLRALR